MITLDTEGLHPSTISCIEALQWLHGREPFKNIAEIGCGNGILSAVAASIWQANVLAADISPKAIEDTKKNIADYKLESLITPIRSDGFTHKDISANAPYDLVIANLLAELQLRMAPDIKKHCRTGGYLLLSGILEWKSAEIEQAYTSLGFEIQHKIINSPWTSYIFRHQTDIN